MKFLTPLQIEQEFGISSPSRLPRGITPLNDTSSTLKDDLNNTLKYTDVESSAPVKGQIGKVPDSPALSVIYPDQSSLEVVFTNGFLWRVLGCCFNDDRKTSKSNMRKIIIFKSYPIINLPTLSIR